jgi:Tfp pilus assembly protein PilX
MKARPRFRRAGTVLIVALVALVVVMAMLGSMLTGTLRARRQLHAERDRRQTELLLQAGLERAAFQLGRDAAYRGESWELAADDVVGTGEGKVTIAASREADDQPWQINVVAEYPRGSPLSVRRSQTFTLSAKTPRQE